MLARVRRTLTERDLLAAGDAVVVACSGGPDSAALLAVLARLAPEFNLTLHAASVDHGLRQGAAADVEVARAQATRMGVPFHALRAHVPHGASVQGQARSARYAALSDLGASLGAACVAVGHTRDDQVETVLMRLLRGAGVGGLAGIRPRRQDRVIRPLIDCDRSEVHAYAKTHFEDIASDPSNEDSRFERVRVRNHLVPALLAEDPQLHAHLSDLADEARELSDWLQTQAEARLGQLGGQARSLTFSADEANSPVFPRVIRLWVRNHANAELGRAHLVQVRRAVAAPAEIWLPGGFRIESRGDGVLRLLPPVSPAHT